jgi:hypothetical protein
VDVHQQHQWKHRHLRATGIAALAVLAAAIWSLTATAGTAMGGTVHVGQVHAAAPPQHAMPGMGTDNDPVAEGRRRVTLDVTLVADDDAALEYSVGRFALDIGGHRVTPHRAVLPGRAVPAGAQLAGSLVFDVPDGARTAVLTFGSKPGTVVQLPPHSAHTP